MHAPQAPWSQPFLVPVRSARSRSMSSSDVRLSTAISRASPLMRIRTTEDAAVFACWSSPQPAINGAVATTPPTAIDAPTNVLRVEARPLAPTLGTPACESAKTHIKHTCAQVSDLERVRDVLDPRVVVQAV